MKKQNLFTRRSIENLFEDIRHDGIERVRKLILLLTGMTRKVFLRTLGPTKRFLRKLKLLPMYVFGVPLVAISIVIRRLVLIRFGTLRSERIGHFSADIEAYLCKTKIDRDANSKTRVLDFIGCKTETCNMHLKKMWQRKFRIYSGYLFWSLLEQSCKLIPTGNQHRIILSGLNNDFKYFRTTPPNLTFTQGEEIQGQELLDSLGVPRGASWICIHNRDGAYLGKALKGNWSYHDYRDFEVSSFILAANELTRLGYFVIRVGSIQAETLNIENPMVVDYASSPYRSDFGDIYLNAKCQAYIGSDSGIASVPLTFRKPVCYINFSLSIVDAIPKQGCYDLPFIPKHLFHKGLGRYLSLREVFSHGLYHVGDGGKYEEAGVIVVSNSSVEIRDVALEVIERLQGQWHSSQDDEILQLRFWEILREHDPRADARTTTARIGMAFLRQHTYLLS